MAFQHLDEFIKQFSDSLPPKIHYLKSEFEAELYRILSLALKNLKLVTRHEFDIQTRELANIRDKLEKLEQKVSILENSIS